MADFLLGGTYPTNIRLGNSAVSKIMHGTVQVWPRITSKDIIYINSGSKYNIAAYTAIFPITISADAKLLVISISAIVNGVVRNNNIPTWNDVNMTKAAGNAGYSSEIWYIINPATGAHNLSIPSSNTTLDVIYSWYKSNGTISLFSGNYSGGTGTTIGTGTTTPSNKPTLIVDNVTYMSGTYLNHASNSDNYIEFGVMGDSFGSSSQYKIYTSSGAFYTPTWTISSTFLYNATVACFQSD